MDGGLLSDLEFFPPDPRDKPASNVALAGAARLSTNFDSGPGLYQNEESVDFSWILDACGGEVPSTVVSVPSPRSGVNVPTSAQQQRGYREAPNEAAFLRRFCTPTPPSPAPSAQPPNSNNSACINMYDVENSGEMSAGISLPHSRTTITSLSEHNPLMMSDAGSDQLVGTRPAPGKSPKKSKKRSLEKNTKEYREKRERNNVAVRKSREKNRQQILETQQRVKELEDENAALQSKITLLSKELKVLKDLFSSAGVSQPSTTTVAGSRCMKNEPDN